MIKTYPRMNTKIVDILRSHGDPILLYAAQRIEELETATAHLEHLDAASQRVLALAMHENRVHVECLEFAMKTLREYPEEFGGQTAFIRVVERVLWEINERLAELKPEEETGNAGT